MKGEIAAIRADYDLSDEQKKSLVEAKMQLLYGVSGDAKLKGILEQVERALAEGLILQNCAFDNSTSST